MRTLKYSLLIASLALISFRCGGGKPAPDAWASIIKNKMVRIATDPVNVPFEFGLGTDVQGYDVDLGNEIAKDLGYPARWVKVSFDRIFDVLKNGEVELAISTIAINDELRKEFAFSLPYFDSGNTIARRRDNPAIKDRASLTGKRVGVQSGRTGDTFMTAQKISTLTRFKTLDDALGALNRGEIDAVVGDKPIITYSIYKSYTTNLITTDVELTKNQYAVLVRPEEIKLLDMINTTIARLKNSGDLERNRDKWLQNVIEETKGEIQAIEKEEQLKAAPKSITVTFIKEAGNTTRMDRLDGFDAQLTGPGGSFKSTAIETNEAGVRGGCKFTMPIPPGDYKFSLPRIGATASLTIEKKPVTSMILIATFTSKGDLIITFK